MVEPMPTGGLGARGRVRGGARGCLRRESRDQQEPHRCFRSQEKDGIRSISNLAIRCQSDAIRSREGGVHLGSQHSAQRQAGPLPGPPSWVGWAAVYRGLLCSCSRPRISTQSVVFFFCSCSIISAPLHLVRVAVGGTPRPPPGYVKKASFAPDGWHSTLRYL